MSKKTKRTSELDVLIGKQLQKRRIMLDLSQEKLAESVGITFQQIQKYETGTNRIAAARLLQFSFVLGCSVDYFYQTSRENLDSGKLKRLDLGNESAGRNQHYEDAKIYKAGKVIFDIPDKEIRNGLMAIARRITAKLGTKERKEAN